MRTVQDTPAPPELVGLAKGSVECPNADRDIETLDSMKTSRAGARV